MEKTTAWIVTSVLVSGGAILVGVALDSDSASSSSPSAAVGQSEKFLEGEEWPRPSGSAEEMAQTLSVEELIEAWSAFPEEESQLGLHAVYAEALGLLGMEAANAAPALGVHAVHPNPGIRKAVLSALARMGDAGLPYLMEALDYGSLLSVNASDVRWDAAQALAEKESGLEGAIPALLSRVVNFEENVLVRESAVAALVNAGEAALPTLKEVQTAYYARSEEDGLTVTETAILNTINLGLQGIRPKRPAPKVGAEEVGETEEAEETGQAQTEE